MQKPVDAFQTMVALSPAGRRAAARWLYLHTAGNSGGGSAARSPWRVVRIPGIAGRPVQFGFCDSLQSEFRAICFSQDHHIDHIL